MGWLAVRRHMLVIGVLALAVLAAVVGPLRAQDDDRAGSTGDRSRFLTRAGTHLVLGGQRYRGVGVNAYELATLWGTNAGCGAMLDDAALDAFFARLPDHTLVRTWAFQGSMATDPETGRRVWEPLDRVVAAAERHRQLLVIALTDQAGTCDDGHWKDQAWYSGAYRLRHPEPGAAAAAPVSYWDWVREIVFRYRESGAVAMWEPVNEPEASDCIAGDDPCALQQRPCDQTGAARALRAFFDVVGREIKRIDPNHLVGSGALGGPQCGWTRENAAHIHASAGIDVTSYHDYRTTKLLPDDLQSRLREGANLHKPVLVGELGIKAGGTGPGCLSIGDRVARVRAKTEAMLAAGVSGVLVWGWVPDPQPGCAYDIGPDDPVLRTLRVS